MASFKSLLVPRLVSSLFLLVFGLFLLTLAVVFIMEEQHEQRSMLKFLCESGDTPIQCWRKLREVFQDSTMSQGRVRVWHHRFRQGEENIRDKPKSG